MLLFVYDVIGNAPDVGAFSAVKSVIQLDKTVFFLRFCEFNM